MFRVECTNCKAAYQVDERRVPAKGLTMKCPKCRESFLVSPPDKPAVPLEQAALPSPNNFSGTMIGVAGRRDLFTGGGRAADSNVQTQMGLPASRAAKGNDATMIGVAPSAPGGHPPEAAEVAPVRVGSAQSIPAPSKTGRTQDLPVSTPPGPASHKPNTQDTAVELPALKGSMAAGGNFASITPKKSSRINFSSLAPTAKPEIAAKPEVTAKPEVAARPGVAAKPEAKTKETTEPLKAGSASLRASATQPDRAAGMAPTQAELPAVAGKRPAAGWPSTAEGVTDLPAVMAPLKQSSRRDEEADLPLLFSPHSLGAIPGSGAAAGARESSLRESAGTNSPPSNRLLNPTSPEMPSARARATSERDSEPFELDLPAVFSERSSKPQVSAQTVRDLPATVSPTFRAHSAPPPKPRVKDEVIDLDSEGVALESLAPSIPPASADLPDVAGLDLPEVLGGPDLPALPDLGDAGLGFGELDLPTVGSQRGRSALPSVPEFTSRLPSFAPSEPPLGRVSSQPPSFRARQDSFGDFDGVPSFAPSTNNPAFSGASGPEDAGLFDGESFSLGDERSSAASAPTGDGLRSAVRQPASGSSAEEYGQVNLDVGPGGMGTGIDDEMEFGGIPQAESERPRGVAQVTGSASAIAAEPVVSTVDASRERTARSGGDAPKAKKKTPVLVKFAAVTVTVLSVAGAALALKPEVGPFGIYAAQDLFLRGEHQALQTRTNQAVEDARSRDSYAASVAAVTAMDQARLGAKRFVPLKADTAAQELALALRFGGPVSLQSSGQVLLEELKSSGVERAEFRRAAVVQHVLQRDASAPSELASLPRDLFALTVEGEHWLRAENAENAISSWTEAVNQKRCAWTLFGLARAYLSANQLDNALAAIKQVLDMNADHIGAKLLEADAALRSGELDSATLTPIQEVLQNPQLASPTELALAHTLLGEFELANGRTTKAAEAFEKGLAIEPGNARALVSSARALFGAGRHAAALARFQAAVTAAPDSIAPKVGEVRALLAMEQLDQAVAEVQALRQTSPGDIEIALLSGLASLAGAAEEVGRKTLGEAIELSKQPPPARLSRQHFQAVSVEAYVALASSFTKSGQADQAEPILAKAAEQLPGSAALRLAMGDVAFGLGQFERAHAEYAEARKLAPSDTAAAFKQGQALSRLRRFEEAAIAFDQVAKTDANYPGLPLERGLILDKSGKAAEALAEYEHALQDDPADVDIQLRVGCGRVEVAQGATAVELLKDVLAKRPRSAEANYCLGRALFAQGSNVEALRLMRSAVEFDANSALYRLHLGWVASEMGQVAVARRELNRSLELDQGSVDAYWQRGVLNLKQGAARDATFDFRKALELNPAHVAANADMAQALSQLGKENDALPYWDKAIVGEPNNATWLFRYGKVLVGRRQGEKGTQLLLKALTLVEGQSPTPNWVWQAHYLAALGLADSSTAPPHWRRYLEMSPHDSPYRGEAKRALAKAGQPWEGQ